MSRDYLPEPLGPTSPTDAPASIDRVIPFNISTGPAFPARLNVASVRDRIGSGMRQAFRRDPCRQYGRPMALRNLAIAFCFSVVAAGAAAETITIAALGDSLTQGYGLPLEDGLVPQLEGWLNAAGADVTVINAGVSGDTTAGGLSRVAWTLAPEVDAMIVALGGNDFLRGLDPEMSRENLAGILSAAEAAGVEVLLVGLQAASNYGADYQAAFDAMYPDLAAEFGVALYPNIFAGLLDGVDVNAARDQFMQADGIHPNREGVARIVAAMGPAVLDLVAAARGG
jgi:acyl-CoA thioesterase I